MSLYFKIKAAINEKGLTDLAAFHPQFRLEARSRDRDNEDSLAMRTADPLWMLGRQWQLGEFQGEDNGTAIHAQANYFKLSTTWFTGKNFDKIKMEPGPLEFNVEAMPVKIEEEYSNISETLDLRTQAKIGEQFKRIIRRFHPSKKRQFISKLQSTYPLKTVGEPDSDSGRFIELMRGKAINGADVLNDHKNKKFTNRSADFNLLIPAVKELAGWFEHHYSQPLENNPAGSVADIETWDTEGLCHKFGVHTQEPEKTLDKTKGVSLLAPDYQSGHLDWYAFDKAAVKTTLGTSSPLDGTLPNNLSFAAQPHKRLFAFEDRMINLGDMDIQEEDLIRLMLLDFSLYSGSDWYTLPMPMELGQLCWVHEIKVTDVFGVKTSVVNGEHKNKRGETIYSGPSLSQDNDGNKKLNGLDVWDVFKIRDELKTEFKKEEHFLYMAPTAVGRQESEPLEEVLFLRDEYANMVWGIEKRVLNQKGKVVDAFDQHLELNGPFIPVYANDQASKYARYRFASNVPTNWIPYLLYNDGKLERALMVSNEPDKEYQDIEPLTYLATKDLPTIREEAIPKAGVRVQLTKQRVRWTDGKTYIWMGRKVLPGRGESDSGLKFDYLK